MNRLRPLVIFIFPLLFLFVSLLTLPDYGVNWDTLQHLVRGQIYFHYLTTGKKDFSDILHKHPSSRVSYYETTVLDFPWTDKMTIGHPPLTDILLAASNHIFYQMLGWVNDIQGYHMFIVFITFFTACIVAVWSYQLLGVFASMVSVIALYTYPLLFAEQHFNPKDPAVAAYFTGFLYFLWLGLRKKHAVPIVIAGLFAGLSLGTKFNIFFVVPILFLWLPFVLKTPGVVWKKVFTPYMTAAAVSVPVIAFVIFYSTYPALWSDPVHRIISVFFYYKDIGGSRCFYPVLTAQWLLACSDWNTLREFITTLPLTTVFFSGIGVVYALKKVGQSFFAPVLWVIWLVVTLLCATLPIMTLYGGSLRQIMEFIPAAALLSGAGAYAIRTMLMTMALFKRTRYFALVVSAGTLLLYVPVGVRMVNLHPNENLYYNNLVGGVTAAVRDGYPVAVNTYGNGYMQAIDWMNKNVPFGSNVYLVDGITSAVPPFFFRADIHYHGSASYLYSFDSSYLVELTEPGMDISNYHNTKYVRSFLIPVYQKKVDGVPIVSVWKNDRAHASPAYDFVNEMSVTPSVILVSPDEAVLDVGSVRKLKRLEMRTRNPECVLSINSLYIFLSSDNVVYTRLLNASANFYDAAAYYNTQGSFIFTGQSARFIRLYSFAGTQCNIADVEYRVIAFP